MAFFRSEVGKMYVVAVAVAVAAVVAAMMVSARPEKLQASCADADKYVYPYAAFCSNPATLNTEYHYVARALFSGGLVPEWDESNSTYYVRLTGDPFELGSTYVATHGSSSVSTPPSYQIVNLDTTLRIYNSQTQRALKWRQEGSDEYWLVEAEVDSVSEGATFVFKRAEGLFIPCPLLYPVPQCYNYYLVSDPTGGSSYGGLVASQEEGVVYIKSGPEGSLGDLPIYVYPASFSERDVTMRFPAIRTVTN